MTTLTPRPERADEPPPQPHLPRGVLTLFSIPLGLAGLGGVWVEARSVVGSPAWVEDVLYALAAAFWLLFGARYLLQNVRQRGTFAKDLSDPATGPLTTYIPVVGLLFVPHVGTYSHTAAEWACWVFLAALVLMVARLLAQWFRGEVPLAAVHPGYFLPYVAGASIAGIALVSVGARTAALTAVGTGLFFWVVVSALFFARLSAGHKLPPPAKPLFSVLLASPATAGIALFAANGNQLNSVVNTLVGVIVVMVLAQIMLVPDYRRAGFTLGFWAFAFPIASTTNFAMRWFTAIDLGSIDAWSWVITSLATLGIAAIAARSLVLVLEKHRGNAS